ncbi:MAG: NAD(P)-dependent oxidoreductase [Sulfitobacter sp.]
MASTTTKATGEIRPALVLGGSGHLGAMLAAFWPRDAALRLHSTKPNPGFMVFDLTLDPAKAVAAMTGAGAVICLSGVIPARVAQSADVFSRNTDLALCAIESAHLAGAGRVFVASSAAVYGGARGILDETTACLPVSEYGAAKLAMEEAALARAAELGHPVTMLRIGNVAGADAILGGWYDGMKIDQFADGTTPRRSYIGPKTLAQVIHALSIQDDLPEVLNIAAPGAIEMGKLLDAAGLPWLARTPDKGVIPQVALSTKRLESLVPFAQERESPEIMVGEWREFQARKTKALQ